MIFAVAALLTATGAQAEGAKNWVPPAFTTYAQSLADTTMREHPELLSMTFHGVPPGMDKVYTMFAGSYPDRVGNPDDPDDIDVITKGITIVDPRWHRTKDVGAQVRRPAAPARRCGQQCRAGGLCLQSSRRFERR